MAFGIKCPTVMIVVPTEVPQTLMDDTDLQKVPEVSRCHSWSLTNTIRMKSVSFGKLITVGQESRPQNEWNFQKSPFWLEEETKKKSKFRCPTHKVLAAEAAFRSFIQKIIEWRLTKDFYIHI